MPLYEYQCKDCGVIFEARQKFSDAPLTRCETCGGEVEKLISQTAFALKGGGWFQQGYSGNSAKPACSAAASGGCGGGGCAKAANH